jgi:3-phenylpropionate/cinnamic acid dioxygenase small subunit
VRKSHVLMTVVLLVSLAGMGWVYGQSRTGPATLTGADIAEIERLYQRYSQGLDFAEEEVYLSAWADDAVFTVQDGKWSGKEELRKRWRMRLGGEGTTTLHITTNILITPTEDGGASGRAYWILLDASQKEPRMVQTGHYFDTFVRTPQGWRIKTRGSVRGWDWRLKKP